MKHSACPDFRQAPMALYSADVVAGVDFITLFHDRKDVGRVRHNESPGNGRARPDATSGSHLGQGIANRVLGLGLDMKLTGSHMKDLAGSFAFLQPPLGLGAALSDNGPSFSHIGTCVTCRRSGETEM